MPAVRRQRQEEQEKAIENDTDKDTLKLNRLIYEDKMPDASRGGFDDLPQENSMNQEKMNNEIDEHLKQYVNIPKI